MQTIKMGRIETDKKVIISPQSKRSRSRNKGQQMLVKKPSLSVVLLQICAVTWKSGWRIYKKLEVG